MGEGAHLVVTSSFNFRSLAAQTYIGPVVVSVNPYRQMDIYTPEHVEEYRNRSAYELPPHL